MSANEARIDIEVFTGFVVRPIPNVKSSFAIHSACDRQSFDLGPVESRTGQRRSREKEHSDALQCEESPFSAVQLIDRKSRKMGIIRELWRKLRRKFSAVQTVWRRGRDSNPRYRC